MPRFIAAFFLISIASGCAERSYRNCPNERAGWERPADARKALVVRPNVIHVQSDGHIVWNSQKITREELLARLSSVRQLDPTPQAILSADDTASCRVIEEIRTEMESRIGCKDGRCAEEEDRS